MNDTQIQDFTRKITQSNQTGLVVITYEILLTYLEDSLLAHQDNQYELFRSSAQKAEKALGRLMQTLDFTYPVSRELYQLYQYALTEICRSISLNKQEGIQNARKVLQPLAEAFQEVEKTDHSEPVMKNAQQVTAGMTYGKGHMNETFQQAENSRGFFA